MNVWVITIYEPLPFGEPQTRPQRCGMLIRELLENGHTVELWTSTFEHVQHKYHRRGSKLECQGERFSVQFIDGCGYSYDSSPRRLIHNRQTGKEFARVVSGRRSKPDIIFSPVPILELAEAVIEYSQANKVPVIVDVRDLWPDVYYRLFPKWSHPLVKLLLILEYRRVRRVFSQADGITAVSKTYLDWGLEHAGRAMGSNDAVFPLGYTDAVSAVDQPVAQRAAAMARQFGITEHHFVVSFVGTFCGSYNLETVLESARLLREDDRVRFLIAGTGDGFINISEQVAGLPNVFLLGWLDFVSVRAVLKLSTIGLAPYASDALMSLPNKPFEYMAAGLPLLSSLRGELDELISESGIGLAYEAENPQSLASQVGWFLSHPDETSQMGLRALSLFQSQFRNDMIYPNIVKLLERIGENDSTLPTGS
jgi:glycosyltransferase involved in cell wall biosynthesis